MRKYKFLARRKTRARRALARLGHTDKNAFVQWHARASHHPTAGQLLASARRADEPLISRRPHRLARIAAARGKPLFGGSPRSASPGGPRVRRRAASCELAGIRVWSDVAPGAGRRGRFGRPQADDGRRNGLGEPARNRGATHSARLQQKAMDDLGARAGCSLCGIHCGDVGVSPHMKWDGRRTERRLPPRHRIRG